MSKWDWCLNVFSSQLCIKLLRTRTVYNHDGVTGDGISKWSRYLVDLNLQSHKYQLWRSCEAVSVCLMLHFYFYGWEKWSTENSLKDLMWHHCGWGRVGNRDPRFWACPVLFLMHHCDELWYRIPYLWVNSQFNPG